MLQNRYRRRFREDNESSEPDTKRNTRVNEELDRRRQEKEDEDTGRMSIAERLRRKNKDLLQSASEERTTSSSISDRYTSSRGDRDSTSGTGGSSLRTNRTTLSSTSSSGDSGDSKELQRKLDEALKDVQDYKSKCDDYKSKYDKVLKEKEDLEKKLAQYRDDIEKMQELKNDNLRLKDENGALIRVISKLSRTPASSSS